MMSEIKIEITIEDRLWSQLTEAQKISVKQILSNASITPIFNEWYKNQPPVNDFEFINKAFDLDDALQKKAIKYFHGKMGIMPEELDKMIRLASEKYGFCGDLALQCCKQYVYLKDKESDE